MKSHVSHAPGESALGIEAQMIQQWKTRKGLALVVFVFQWEKQKTNKYMVHVTPGSDKCHEEK